jgi:hypothetical protein
MPTSELFIESLRCRICHHGWIPRSEALPFRCPTCGSRKWKTGSGAGAKGKHPRKHRGGRKVAKKASEAGAGTKQEASTFRRLSGGRPYGLRKEKRLAR